MWDFKEHKILEEAKRQQGRRVVNLGTIELNNEGVRVAHKLGTIPNQWHIVAIERNGIVPTSWWFYREPDSNYLYLKASGTGRFLITVAGG